MSRNVAVIGAGASGIVAAIAAARCGASVSIFEHTDSIGSKIMITGNGKCNYTNEDIRPEHYHSGTDEDGLIASILERFGYEDCTGFFGSLGIIGKNRRGGIYPYTDTAESVRSALKLELKRLGVEIICGCSNTGLERATGGGIRVKNDLEPDGRVFDAVILSCGGKAARKTGSDGSGFELVRSLGVVTTDIFPALTPLPVKEDLSMLTGIRCDASLKLINEKGRVIERSSGELQPYDKGLSGICALDISGNACRRTGAGERVFVECDFYPGTDDEGFKRMMADRREAFPERDLTGLLTGIFPRKLIRYMAHPIDIRKDSWPDDLKDIVKHHRYEVSRDILKDMSRAQTSAGGVSLGEIDCNCMLRREQDIYVTGEMLDADGICGGYNLHFAWATGYIAGGAAAGDNS